MGSVRLIEVIIAGAAVAIVGWVVCSAPADETERAGRAIERYGFIDPVVGGWSHPGCGSLAECTAFTAVSPFDHLALSGFVACEPSGWPRNPGDCIVHVDSRPFRPPPALEKPDHR